ncbi:MAG: prolyl oligopeptidase family serine peptidase [Candidatus Eisenbacteria bacterium]
MRRQARAATFAVMTVVAISAVMGAPTALGASGGASEYAGEDRVEALLREVDPWIATDDSRVAEFIERHNQITDERITSSSNWPSVYADLSDVLSIDYVASPDLDNTGRIYFQMRITGERGALFYVDEPWGWPTQITPNAWTERNMDLGDYVLDPDGNYLYLEAMEQGDENWDIYRFERDGTYRPLLVDRELAFSSPFRDGDDGFFFHIMDLKRGGFWLARYDLASAAVETLYTETMPFGPVDYHNGKVLCVRFKTASELQLFEYDVSNRETSDLTGYIEVREAYYASDGSILMVSDALSGEDEFYKVTLMDPADAPVEPNEMRVIYAPDVEIDGITFSRETGVAGVALNRDGYNELVRLDLEGNVTELPAPGVGIIGSPSVNDSGDMVFDFNSPSTPPTVLYLGVSGSELEQVASISTFGHDFSGVEVNVVRYPSTDGTLVPALLYVPEGAARDGSNPCIVNYHGGPSGQSVPAFQRNIAFALARGVVFCFPNVRGSTGYGPTWERADNLDGRYQALEDAEAALDYLVAEGWTSPERTAIWGASYGGYTVNYLAVHAPDKFACGISEVGVSDIDWTIEHGNPGFVEAHEAEFGPLGSDMTRGLSAVYFADNVRVPLLVTAGSNDPRVPPSDPRRFAWVLEKLGKDVLYKEETEFGHGVSGRAKLTGDLAGSYTFIFDHIME